MKEKYTEHDSIQMFPDKAMEESISGSQNFSLKLSQDSTVSNTFDTNEGADIIVISDSESSSESTCSSAKYNSKSLANKYPVKNNQVYIIESSDSDCTDRNAEKLFQAWKLKKKAGLIRHNQIRKHAVTSNNVLYTSDESSPVNNEHVTDGITNSTKSSSSYNATSRENNVKIMSKRNIQSPTNTLNEADSLSSSAISSSHSSSASSKSAIRQTRILSPLNPVHNGFKKYLSRNDNKNIIKNIRSTKLVYESPKVQKQTNSVLPEGVDNSIIHPAISPESKMTKVNTIINESQTNSESDVILSSQVNLVNTYKTHVSRFLNTPHVEKDIGEACNELSEQKKKQISQWLLANSSDSQSDSSLSIVGPSNRQDISSGNSSLERLEMNYETPNNRNKIRQQQASEKEVGQMNCNETPRATVPRQTTINDYIQRSKNNGFELGTSTKKNHTNNGNANNNMFSTVITSPAVNAPQQVNIQDCADILDKLYGQTWRAKADVLFANSEPRRKMSPKKNRCIQTERKVVNKGRLYISDSDGSDTSFKDLRLQKHLTKKGIKKNAKQRTGFIIDESTSESGCESLYHTALTNPRVSTNSEQSKQKIPPIARRVLAICDTDTEEEDEEEGDTNGNNKISDIRRRKLSFSDDENDNSSTSEFDPGDDVPPKPIGKKGFTRTKEHIPARNNQIKSTAENKKYEKHKSFLASLSESIPITDVDPDAKKYRLDYKNNKESLCNYLYKLYNEKVFDKNLPEDMSIEWNVRMRGTAGFCYNKKSVRTLGGIVKSSRLVLATKVLDTPDRLRDTLIHEMCHAAAWLINDVSDGHGPFWTGWAKKAMKTFPELPPIRRCHDYKIKTKFTYKCVGCGYSIGRHSKSLDIERKRCGHCYGKFELLINKTTKSGTVQMQTPKREPSAFALYVKENYNSVKKQRNIKHGEVMKILGQQFSAVKIAKGQENNENDLG